MYTYTCICTYAHMHIHLCACIYLYVGTPAYTKHMVFVALDLRQKKTLYYIHIYMCVCVHTCVCVFTWMCLCVCENAHVQIHQALCFVCGKAHLQKKQARCASDAQHPVFQMRRDLLRWLIGVYRDSLECDITQACSASDAQYSRDRWAGLHCVVSRVCSTLQQTAKHCNSLQLTATHRTERATRRFGKHPCVYAATHCNTLHLCHTLLSTWLLGIWNVAFSCETHIYAGMQVFYIYIYIYI